MSLFEKFQRIYSRIESYSKPLIAAINGVTIGGGLELALVCDVRVASEVAYFSMPELRHGIIPGLGIGKAHVRLTATRACHVMSLASSKILRNRSHESEHLAHQLRNLR